MRKIILAIILFTSCRVPDNKAVPALVTKTTEAPTPIKKTPKAHNTTQSSENNIAIEENTEKPGAAGKKHTKTKAAGCLISTDKQLEPAELNSAIDTDAKDETNDDNGASNYQEGYIPFIKQYW